MVVSLTEYVKTLGEDELQALSDAVETGDLSNVNPRTIQNLVDNVSEEELNANFPVQEPAQNTQSQFSPQTVDGVRLATPAEAAVAQQAHSIRPPLPVEEQQMFSSKLGREPLRAVKETSGDIIAREAARAGIELGSEIAGMVGGQAVGGLFGSAVGGTIMSQAGRDITRGMGLRPPASALDRFDETMSSAGEQALGIAAERGFRTFQNMMPPSVRMTARGGEFLFERPVIKSAEELEMDVVVGNDTMKVSDVMRQEGEDLSSLTVSQKTGGRLGQAEAQALAESSRQAQHSLRGSALRKSDDAFLKRRAEAILDGTTAIPDEAEHFDTAFKKIVVDRISDLKKDNEALRNISAADRIKFKDSVRFSLRAPKDKVLVTDYANVSPQGIEAPLVVIPEGADLGEAINLFKSTVEGVDAAVLDKTFEDVLDIVTDEVVEKQLVTRTPAGFASKPIKEEVESRRKEVISEIDPARLDALTSRIDKLKGEYRTEKVSQSQVAGVLARFEREVLMPMLSAADDPAAQKILANRDKFTRNAEELAKLEEAKVARSIGLTEAQQGKKAAGEPAVLRGAFSSEDAFKQVQDVLESTGQYEVLQNLKDQFVRNVWDLAVSDRKLLRAKDVAVPLQSKKLRNFLNKEENRRMVRLVKGDVYLNKLDRTTALLEAREGDPVLLRSIARSPEEQESLANLMVQKLGAKLTGHTLRDASISLAILSRIPMKIVGGIVDEQKLLAKLSDPNFVSKWDMAMATEITNPMGHAVASSILREFGIPLSKSTWETLAEMMQSGQFDTVPQDLADEWKAQNAQNQ